MTINSSKKAVALFGNLISRDVEEFWVAALDPSLNLLEARLLFRGTVDQCAVHPRDILRFICCQNASSFIVCHNHPSGNPQPSIEDRKITRVILELARLVEIPLRDHLILAGTDFFSFADAGYLVRWLNERRRRRSQSGSSHQTGRSWAGGD